MTKFRFVILSQPRTGSTLICSLLSSHQGVRALCEPINPTTHNHHMRPIVGSNCLMPENLVQNNLIRALDYLFAEEALPDKWILSKRKATIAAGFKIMAHQIQGLRNEEIFWEYLHRYDIKVVIVFRNNIVMQYISDLIVAQTRQCTCWTGDPRTAKVEVPIDSLRANLRRIRQEKQYLFEKSKLLDRRKLAYEEFKDTVEPVRIILPWLTGEEYFPTTKLQKQNPDSMKNRVTNYKALIKELQRLKLDHLIVDN